MREHLKEHFLKLLGQAAGQSCLVWYSNDTSPLVTRQTMRNKVGDLRFIEHLRRSGEFVLQRMFLEDGQGNKAVVLADLIRVPNNIGETHFECFRRLMP